MKISLILYIIFTVYRFIKVGYKSDLQYELQEDFFMIDVNKNRIKNYYITFNNDLGWFVGLKNN